MSDERLKSIAVQLYDLVKELYALVSDEAEMTDTITRHNITWKFDRPVQHGTYANGDPWVLGPVTIVSTDGDGSMFSPKPGKAQGFTPAVNAYVDGLGVKFPVTIDKGSLITVTEYPDPDKHTKLADASILTVVSSIPDEKDFRPPYCGQAYFNADKIDMSVLKNVAPTASIPNREAIEEMVERFWLFLLTGHLDRQLHPHNNMGNYGAQILKNVGQISLWLNCDVLEKEQVLVNFLQKGIDLYGITQVNDSMWWADGAANMGRLWPIVFAGIVLGNEDMQNIADKARFAEVDHTFYVTADMVDDTTKYAADDIGMPEWRYKVGKEYNGYWEKGYRHIFGPKAYGMAICAMLMGSNFNHQAYFDYMDRYDKMTMDDNRKPDFGRDMFMRYRQTI